VRGHPPYSQRATQTCHSLHNSASFKPAAIPSDNESMPFVTEERPK
jgi:hypothetical protein